MPAHRTAPAMIVLLGLLGAPLVGCTPADDAADDPRAGPATEVEDRPASRTDTVLLEGMAETIELELFRTPENFPLPFTAYVPADMAASADTEDGTAHVVAEFGGVRNEDAFVHLYVFPAGTPWQEAVATARGYEAGRGIPAGRNVEPIAEDLPEPSLDWAGEAYRYRYQAGGQWFGGTIGVGTRQDRPFLILRHWPAEYVEGFSPRADFIMETWRWSDGSPLGR